VAKQKTKPADAVCETIRCMNCKEDPIDDYPECSRVKIVKLETNDACLITDIGQIEIKDSLLFITDMTWTGIRLFVFNMDGKFIAQIGNEGQSGSEYILLNTFFIKDSSVFIVDDVKCEFLEYDFEGKYRRSHKIPMNFISRSRQAIFSDDNRLLLHRGISGLGMDDNMAYSLIDMKNLELTGKYFTYDPIKLDNHICYYSRHPMVKVDDGIDFIMPLCDTVYTYSSSSFSPRYIIETPKKMASKHQMPPLSKSYFSDVIDLGMQGFFTGFTALFETKDNIYLNYQDGIIAGYFLGDKTTKQGYYYMGGSTRIKKVPFFHIIHSFDNTFVGISQADYLFQKPFEFDFAPDYREGQEFQKMLSEIKEDDNPVLFFYEL
jgi:hypothetical protein